MTTGDTLWMVMIFAVEDNGRFLGAFSTKDKALTRLKDYYEEYEDDSYVLHDTGDVVDLIYRNGKREIHIGQVYSIAVDKAVIIDV